MSSKKRKKIKFALGKDGKIKPISTDEIVTESIEVLPHGRGRVVVIAHKRVMKKPRFAKDRSPRLCLVRIKSNPNDIAFAAYLNKDRIIRFYLFPEKRQLSSDERLEFAAALLATIERQRNCLITILFRKEIERARRRYLKWRKRNQ